MAQRHMRHCMLQQLPGLQTSRFREASSAAGQKAQRPFPSCAPWLDVLGQALDLEHVPLLGRTPQELSTLYPTCPRILSHGCTQKRVVAGCRRRRHTQTDTHRISLPSPTTYRHSDKKLKVCRFFKDSSDVCAESGTLPDDSSESESELSGHAKHLPLGSARTRKHLQTGWLALALSIPTCSAKKQ